MANMSYCKFQNTLHDLMECEESIHDVGLSEDEEQARKRLIRCCQRIAAEFTADHDDED